MFFPNPQFFLEKDELNDQVISEQSLDDSGSIDSCEKNDGQDRIEELLKRSQSLNVLEEFASDKKGQKYCSKCTTPAQYQHIQKNVFFCRVCALKCLIIEDESRLLTADEIYRKTQIQDYLCKLEEQRSMMEKVSKKLEVAVQS